MKLHVATKLGAWRPTCHVVVRNNATASAILAALREAGWIVVQHASGYHLVEALADAILGERPWDQFKLIVVDDASPGCLGASIAKGLREVGAGCPLVIIASGRDPHVHAVEDPDHGIHVLDPIAAPAGVARIAQHVHQTAPPSRSGSSSMPPESARA